MSSVIPLSHSALAKVAPSYEAMRGAIARCEKVDEIANLADQAVAAQAYFRQSQDVDNEMQASRIRVRAERRLGEILRRMAMAGERAGKGDRVANVAPRDISTLDNLGIPRDRASRAMQLAEVPQEQFDAALAEQQIAQPRRILRELREPPKPEPLVPIDKTLALWGKVRDFGSEIEGGGVPDVALWRENLQPFQLEHLRKYVPVVIAYLTAIQEGL